MYVDYAFYKDIYGGKVSEENFRRLNTQTQKKLDYYTFNRLSKLETIPQNAKFAICEVIDYLKNKTLIEEQINSTEPRISSETIGKHSVSFKYNDEIIKTKVLTDKDHETNIYNIIAKYLINEQNLMYRGVSNYDYRI